MGLSGSGLSGNGPKRERPSGKTSKRRPRLADASKWFIGRRLSALSSRTALQMRAHPLLQNLCDACTCVAACAVRRAHERTRVRESTRARTHGCMRLHMLAPAPTFRIGRLWRLPRPAPARRSHAEWPMRAGCNAHCGPVLPRILARRHEAPRRPPARRAARRNGTAESSGGPIRGVHRRQAPGQCQPRTSPRSALGGRPRRGTCGRAGFANAQNALPAVYNSGRNGL